MRNNVYAFDADGRDALPLWHVNLGTPMRYSRIPKDAGAQLGQYNVRPFIGITSTPIIDRAARIMYVIAKIAESECPGTDEARPQQTVKVSKDPRHRGHVEGTSGHTGHLANPK